MESVNEKSMDNVIDNKKILDLENNLIELTMALSQLKSVIRDAKIVVEQQKKPSKYTTDPTFRENKKIKSKERYYKLKNIKENSKKNINLPVEEDIKIEEDILNIQEDIKQQNQL